MECCKCHGDALTVSHYRTAEPGIDMLVAHYVIYFYCPCGFTLHHSTNMILMPAKVNKVVIQGFDAAKEYMNEFGHYYTGKNEKGLYEFIVF